MLDTRVVSVGVWPIRSPEDPNRHDTLTVAPFSSKSPADFGSRRFHQGLWGR